MSQPNPLFFQGFYSLGSLTKEGRGCLALASQGRLAYLSYQDLRPPLKKKRPDAVKAFDLISEKTIITGSPLNKALAIAGDEGRLEVVKSLLRKGVKEVDLDNLAYMFFFRDEVRLFKFLYKYKKYDIRTLETVLFNYFPKDTNGYKPGLKIMDFFLNKRNMDPEEKMVPEDAFQESLSNGIFFNSLDVVMNHIISGISLDEYFLRDGLSPLIFKDWKIIRVLDYFSDKRLLEYGINFDPAQATEFVPNLTGYVYSDAGRAKVGFLQSHDKLRTFDKFFESVNIEDIENSEIIDYIKNMGLYLSDHGRRASLLKAVKTVYIRKLLKNK